MDPFLFVAMFPRSGSVASSGGSSGGSGGGGTTTPPPDLSGYVTTAQLATTAQGWIRGNGTFRPVLQVFGTQTVTDNFWQCWLVALNGLLGITNTVVLNVTAPSATLVSKTNSTVVEGAGEDILGAPAGAWTLIMNVNNTASVTIRFPEAGAIINGRAADGSFLTGGTNSQFTLAQGKMALLMNRGGVNYYLHLF